MEAVIDYFSGGKYSKALNEAAKVREEMAIERAEMAALKDKIMKIRAEKTAFAAEIAALKDKAAFAEEKDAFAKEKDKILISNLYNDKVELDTINHSFWLNIDEIKKSFQISDLFLPFTN
jgi:hypothetical protein